MIKIKLPDTLDYYNLYTLTGITPGKSVVVTSEYTKSILLERTTSKPAPTANDGYPLPPGETTVVYGSGTTPIWIKGEDGYVVVQELSAQTANQYSIIDLPKDVWTQDVEGFRRLRVDPGQTGFFSGKFFRSYIEASIPVAGPSLQFRFTSPIDFILWSQVLEITQGAVDFRVYAGATSTGSWTALPVFGINRMAKRQSPYYTNQVTIERGGNFTGGNEVDLLKVRASSSNNSANNVSIEAGERGLPAGTYHARFKTLTGGLTVDDAAKILYRLIWEERP